MNTLCAFSSDYRDLYKADIYRALSLPQGHILHFRYKKKYVDDNILNTPQKILDKEVVIFHSPGNKTAPDNAKLDNISIRKAKITKSYISTDTDVFHIYMRLTNFCNVAIDSNNPVEKQPKQKFLSELNCTEKSENSNWQSRVQAISSHFPEITYLYIKGIYKKRFWNKDALIKPTLNHCRTFSSYDIKHGKKYSIKLSIGNPDERGAGITVDGEKEILTLNCINPLETSAQFDDFSIPLSVKSLAANNQVSLVSFKPLSNTSGINFNEYTTNIEFDLKLSLQKAAHFGILATIAATALMLVQPYSPNDIRPNGYEMVIAGVLFWFSSGALFYWFNKK